MAKTSVTVSWVMGITLVGKVLGLWRDRLLAISYGTGMEANAFYTASRIPRVFFDTIFASAIAVCLIPVFGKLLSKEGEEKAYDFAGNFLSVMGLITGVITLVGMGFAEEMVELFAHGYDLETKALATQLTTMLFPTVFFTGIAFSFVGILQGRERFFIPALLSTVSNSVIILYFYIGNAAYGIYGLAVAYLLGWLAQVGVQLPSLKAIGFRYRPNFSPFTQEMKQVFALMAPVMISTWVQPMNLTVHARFASGLHGGGGVSMMEISTNLYLIIAGVFILSITNVIFPRLSQLEAKGEGLGETMGETLHIALFFLFPMSAGLMAVAQPLVALFYGGGAFGAEEVQYTAQALQWISLGMVGYGVQNIVSRGFFAQENGSAPLIAGVCSMVANLLLCLSLVGPLQVEGLALASAISSLLYGAMMLWAWTKTQGKGLSASFYQDCGKMLLAAAGMYGCVRVVMSASQGFSELIQLVLGASVGGVVYLTFALVLGLWEMDMVKNKLKRGK